MIALGSTEISKVCLGSNDLSKVCLGSTELWSSGPSPFPYDAEVEYLQSTGTQWIDLGFKATNNIQLDISFNRPSDSVRFDCGAEDGWSSKIARFVVLENNGNVWWRYGASSSSSSTVTTANKLVGDIRTLITNRSCSVTNHTTNITYNHNGSTTSAFTTTGNFVLFGASVGSEQQTDAANSGSRLYRARVVDTGVDLDLIPVRVGQVGYLYDKNSGRLFGKSGVDNFVIGNDKTGVPYDYRVDYIQKKSRTSPLVLFGLYGNMGTDAVEVKFSNVSFAAQDIFIGDNSNTDTRAIRLYVNGSSKYAFYYRSTSNADTWSSTGVDVANGVDTVFKVDYKNGSWSIDNGTQNSGTFSCNSYTSYQNCIGMKWSTKSAPAKFSYAKWWRNDILVLHAIPVVKSGDACFYDEVSGFFLNPNVDASDIDVGSRI